MKRFVWALGLVLVARLLFAAENLPTLPLGAKAPNFKLRGVDKKNYSLADFKRAQILVVVFTCNHCPTAQYYEERIKQIVEDYKKKGVALVAIQPNDQKSVRLDERDYTHLPHSFEQMKIGPKY